MEPERETHYPRQEGRPSATIEVEILEDPGEARDILEIKFVLIVRPPHAYGIDPFEEDVVEIGEHGDEERQGWGASPDEPQLQGAEGLSDGFEAPKKGGFLELTHMKGCYRQVLDWG